MKLAFLHIPKTGGISVEFLVTRALGPERIDRICPLYVGPEYHGKTYDEVAGYDVFIGHFNWTFLKTVPQDYIRATVLREPEHQMLSMLNHIASRPAHGLHREIKEVPLVDFLSRHYSLHNQQSKWVLGPDRCRVLTATGPRAATADTAAAVDEARRNLKRFDVVGLTSRLEDFVTDLGRALGTDMPPPGRRNTNAHITFDAERLSDEERAAIAAATKIDRALLEMAKAEILPAAAA